MKNEQSRDIDNIRHKTQNEDVKSRMENLET